MMRQQGGFKEVIKKAFPEADFSQWSKTPNPSPPPTPLFFFLEN